MLPKEPEVWLAVALVVLFTVLLSVFLGVRFHEYQEFMSECRKDHKNYECVIMWRGR
jgi:hypothetical protein